jgi:nucleoside-diphosphate-sugar epimerase
VEREAVRNRAKEASADRATGAVSSEPTLTIAVTGATGTVGPALLSRLVREESVRRVVVLGRRTPQLPPSGAELSLHAVDVRDRHAVAQALQGADVVIHLAYALYGVASREPDLFATNVEGTLNVARAATVAGARRLVFTSSSAVYGFHADNPRGIDERVPIRASSRHFYGRQKAQAELLIRQQVEGTDTQAFLFRPCAIVGPHAAGGALSFLPDRAVRPARRALAAGVRAGVRPILPAPPVALQFVHEDDVAQALVLAAVGRGPAGTYNLAADDALEGEEVLRLIGVRRFPVPRGIVAGALRAATAIPPVVPAFGWFEVGTAPIILDSSRARDQLGWAPRFSSREALLDTRRAIGW